MKSDLKNISFYTLLDYCSDVRSPNWESAWCVFVERYYPFLYAKAESVCRRWNISRLKLQLKDTAKMIVDDVFETLYKDDCKALREFRERENEKLFRYWLSILCSRAASRFIKKHLPKFFVEQSGDIEDFGAHLPYYQSWEIYEHLVHLLRNSLKTQSQSLERNIQIFMLRSWADFSSRMVLAHPCLEGLSEHNVDVIKFRLVKAFSSSD
ncbi:MAG: hypothetical protein GXO74_09120 [Calditrichaeota bacterium]|nr:hypothetical protein [Calditrichota bacterium]